MTLVIDQIKHGSHAYDQAVALRRRVLRTPLGLDFSAEQLAAEAEDIHVAAFVDGLIAGTAVLTPDGEDAFRLRQMAVDEAYEHQGVGRTLLRHVERVVRSRARSKVVLHARTSAQRFYERYGYQPQGAVFEEVTLPHIEMIKSV